LSKDKAKAEEILNAIAKYSTDDNGNAIICPNCKGEKVQLFSTINGFKSFFAFVIGFVSGTLPFHTRYQYQCEDCQTKFPTQ